MKYLRVLKALSSQQAQRNYLSLYEQIGLSERGKLGMWKVLPPSETVYGNILYPSESRDTVPMKP